MPGRYVTSAILVLAILVAADIGLLVLVWRFQERIVFQPPPRLASADTAMRVIAYRSADGVPLFACVVEPVDGDGNGDGDGDGSESESGSESGSASGRVILAFHGNAVIARWMIPWARELAQRLHATVVLPEYRGYDGIPGSPTYAGARLDAQAALAMTVDRYDVRAADIVYYGHSLGSAVATELAAEEAPRALVLESPFTSARDMAARMPVVGLTLFWSVISRVHYRTRDRVAQLDVPVSVAHGERDALVPVRMGKAVYGAARQKGKLLLVPDAGHNDVAVVGGETYWRWFREAIASGGQ